MKTLVVALVVVVGVLGGFYGGYKVGQSNVSASTGGTPSARASGNPFTRGGAGTAAALCPSPGSTAAASGAQALARGTITSITSTSMTVHTTACDITIDFTTGTAIVKQASGTTSDLADSQTVTVIGTRQSDGSIKAQSISIGGAGGPGAGTGGGG